MSSKPNHRRGEKGKQDNGPTWEGGPPSSGCNSTHVARARSVWKRIGHRAERRTGRRGANDVHYSTGAGQQAPSIDEGLARQEPCEAGLFDVCGAESTTECSCCSLWLCSKHAHPEGS